MKEEIEKKKKKPVAVDEQMPCEVYNEEQENDFTVKKGRYEIKIPKDTELGKLLQKEFNNPENKGKNRIKVDSNSALGLLLSQEIAKQLKQNKKAGKKVAPLGKNINASNKKTKKAKKAKPLVKKKTRIFQMPGLTLKSSKNVPDQSKQKGAQKEPQIGTESKRSEVDVKTFYAAFTRPIPKAEQLKGFVEANGGMKAANKILKGANVAPGQRPQGPAILKR